MKYTLKDYQYEAAEKTLNNLARGRHVYQQFGARAQFSLAAVTGAGKTVISAGVIEALTFGSDEFDVEPDPGAVILWFSDDPAINEQSKARIGSAAPSLINRMWTIENDFALDSLTPGNVYFLNAQKLSKTLGWQGLSGADSRTTSHR
ncbi:DEAD/DEAH box helicase family protein [Flaviflexus equikiangi]|uniref:DEAD/DEAH box helicase family protein n=1 Tax=Flaviflexus equikiangi TaxID=2758573 RepID=A0ABS2TFJ2_9ACTO|nr:DEAD/DEAH box helicase family protein [Flaviflexus equikiangi]MBM9432281.1 DEAD/DEAH box helicase family protein [Flaviflexus equikiangi]